MQSKIDKWLPTSPPKRSVHQVPMRRAERQNDGPQSYNYRQETRCQQKPCQQLGKYVPFSRKGGFNNNNDGDWIGRNVRKGDKYYQRIPKRGDQWGKSESKRRFALNKDEDDLELAFNFRSGLAFAEINSILLKDMLAEKRRNAKGSVSNEELLLESFGPGCTAFNFTLSKFAADSKMKEVKLIRKKSPKKSADASPSKVSAGLHKPVSQDEDLHSPEKPLISASSMKGGFGSFRRGKPTTNVDSSTADASSIPQCDQKHLALDRKAGGCFVFEDQVASKNSKGRVGFNRAPASSPRVPDRSNTARDYSNQRHH